MILPVKTISTNNINWKHKHYINSYDLSSASSSYLTLENLVQKLKMKSRHYSYGGNNWLLFNSIQDALDFKTNTIPAIKQKSKQYISNFKQKKASIFVGASSEIPSLYLSRIAKTYPQLNFKRVIHKTEDALVISNLRPLTLENAFSDKYCLYFNINNDAFFIQSSKIKDSDDPFSNFVSENFLDNLKHLKIPYYIGINSMEEACGEKALEEIMHNDKIIDTMDLIQYIWDNIPEMPEEMSNTVFQSLKAEDDGTYMTALDMMLMFNWQKYILKFTIALYTRPDFSKHLISYLNKNQRFLYWCLNLLPKNLHQLRRYSNDIIQSPILGQITCPNNHVLCDDGYIVSNPLFKKENEFELLRHLIKYNLQQDLNSCYRSYLGTLFKIVIHYKEDEVKSSDLGVGGNRIVEHIQTTLQVRYPTFYKIIEDYNFTYTLELDE